MKKFIISFLCILCLTGSAFGKKNKIKGDWQEGTFVAASTVQDGTFTDNIHCGQGIGDSWGCSGSAGFNRVGLYRVRVADGIWTFETARQVDDTATQKILGFPAVHFKKEKLNPLDLLRNGDRVMFRIVAHKPLFDRTYYDFYIPYADNPNKEVKFVGWFTPFTLPASPPQKPTDNVKAMCDSHQLSLELEKKYCTEQKSQPVLVIQASPPVSASDKAHERLESATRWAACQHHFVPFAGTDHHWTTEELDAMRNGMASDPYSFSQEQLDACLAVK
jgi:hypothetical protein